MQVYSIMIAYFKFLIKYYFIQELFLALLHIIVMNIEHAGGFAYEAL